MKDHVDSQTAHYRWLWCWIIATLVSCVLFGIFQVLDVLGFDVPRYTIIFPLIILVVGLLRIVTHSRKLVDKKGKG